MPLDPRIILQAGQLGSPQAFNSILQGIQGFKAERERKALMPLEIQLKEAQLGRQQQALSADELRNNATRRNDFITSTAQGAQEFLPRLKAGDIIGAGQALSQRRERLISQGLPTETTDEAIELLDSNPDLLIQRAEQAIQAGRQLGGQGDGLTPRQRELEQFKGLPESTPEEALFKRQFGQGIGAIAKRAGVEERVDIQTAVGDVKAGQDIEVARGKERVKLSEQLKDIPQRERVSFLSKNRQNFEEDISLSGNILGEIDRAIEIWETAPGTVSGPLASRFPALADDTQELESILAGLGIDRLSNFKGATSERELATAFRAGASIEQDKVAGIRRLKKQRRGITRNNDRLRGLLTESKTLLRREPEPQQPQAAEGLPSGATPEETQRGGVLNVDAQGNRAIVFPDGTFREVN